MPATGAVHRDAEKEEFWEKGFLEVILAFSSEKQMGVFQAVGGGRRAWLPRGQRELPQGTSKAQMPFRKELKLSA